MNTHVKNILGSILGQDWVICSLELAEMNEPDDYVNLDNNLIDKIENYIRVRASLMEPHVRKSVIHGAFFDHPDRFVYSPGIRCRLLRAAKSISHYSNAYNSVYSSESVQSLMSNESGKVNPNDSRHWEPAYIPQLNSSNSKMHMKDPSNNNHKKNHHNNTSNQFLNATNLIKHEPYDSSKHFENLDKYYHDICKNASKNFVNCSLKPKIDFHITISDEENSGFYVCNICYNRKKTKTKIKFRFSKYNSVIYTNINSHLRSHFQHVMEGIEQPDRKKSKLSAHNNSNGVLTQNSNQNNQMNDSNQNNQSNNNPNTSSNSLPPLSNINTSTQSYSNLSNGGDTILLTTGAEIANEYLSADFVNMGFVQQANFAAAAET